MKKGSDLEAAEEVELKGLLARPDDHITKEQIHLQELKNFHSDNLDYTGKQVFFWLAWWFINNIGITLLNKAAFKTVSFNFPLVLSAIHMICNILGAWAYLHYTQEERKILDTKGNYIMVGFSVIFAVNIAFGNISLRYVSVNFNQVMRSLVPAIVMAWDMFTGKIFSFNKKAAVLPVVLGVALACYGDMHFSLLGFIVTVMCVIMAAVKAILAGKLLTGDYQLGAFDLLSRMSSLSFIWLCMGAYVMGELDDMMNQWNDFSSFWAWTIVWLSGIASFSLNIASFMANKVTSPLTLTIVSNAKQVCLIVIATILFGTEVSLLNGIGIVLVLVGSTVYSYVSTTEKNKLKREIQGHK